jgi:carbamoyltransferase
MRILGVWDGHDSGAALFVDGRLVAAINEERLTRRKLEIRFPEQSIHACLKIARLTPQDVQVVAVSTTDVAKTLARWFPSTREAYYAVRRRKTPPGIATDFTRHSKYWVTEWGPNRISRWLSKLSLQRQLQRLNLDGAELCLVDHHLAHAAAAAAASGMNPCAVVTIDGVGDGLSSSISVFRDGRLARVAASPARHSLGVMFEHVTRLLNMRELEDEGKVMALADHVSPVADADNPLLRLITVAHGRFWCAKTGRALVNQLKRIQWFHANEQFAYMAQRVVELRTVEVVRDAIGLTGLRRVALAGGVVSNVKANRHVRLMPEVEHVYVFPHMGDGGLAVGAAVAAASDKGHQINLDLSDLALGPEYSEQSVAAMLEANGLRAIKCQDLPERVADLIARDAIVLWFQGRMEYGPRSLGHRSVLARPDSRAVRDRLNLVLKRRVWYQPFCPTLLESEAARVFSDWSPSTNSHMTMAYMVAPAHREAMAGVIGVDGSCRPQIVNDSSGDAFAELLRAIRRRLKLAVLLNTSYNIHGEPLVCTPQEALSVFERCGADALAIGPYLVVAESPRPQRPH